MKVSNQLQLALSRNKKRKLKPLKPKPPIGIERSYQRDLVKYLEVIDKAIKEILLPELPYILNEQKADRPIIKQDDPSDDLSRLMAQVKLRIQQDYSDEELTRLATIYGLETSKKNKDELKKNLKRVVGIDVISADSFLRKELTAFTVSNVKLITSMKDETLNKVEGLAFRAFQSGQRAEDLSKNIEKLVNPRVSNIRARANLIARDQIAKLSGQLDQLRQTDLGISKYIWRTSGDERVRDTHRELEGTEHSWNDPPITNDQGDRNHPGQDYQCVPGNTLISIGQSINKLFRRPYTGKLTELVSSSGKTLYATSNHPVFTHSGWKPAHEVQVGDYIFDATVNSISFLEVDNIQMQTSISNLFDSIFPVFNGIKHRSAEGEFHGDAIINENVDIIDIQRILMLHGESFFLKNLTQFYFTNSNTPGLTFGDFEFLFDGFLDTFHGFVCRMRELFSLAQSELGHSKDISLASSSSFDAEFVKPSSQNVSGNSVFIGNSKLAQAFLVFFNGFKVYFHFIPHSLPLKDFDIPSSKELTESIGIHPENFGDLFQCLGAVHVKFNRVVDKSFIDFSGHVYNLETKSNWYSANNTIIHNCRCVAEPVISLD